MIEFPVSGVETYWWLPVVVAFLASAITSTGGLSGAFVLLPFQVSVLGFTGPGVSPTNLIFNILAIPSGVYRFYRERRIVWPLAGVIIVGTLPGMFLGAVIRISYLPDPRSFKFFVGLVLLYIGSRLGSSLLKKSPKVATAGNRGGQFVVSDARFNLKRVQYDFDGETHQASTPGIFILCSLVGVVGGIYGIGGGAIIAPFLVAFYRLPVYTVAGAALLGTFVTSIAGVSFYILIAPLYAATNLQILPDWGLGAMFGIGGAAGIYLGARLQRYLPASLIKAILTVALLFIALRYIIDFF